ncbi:hypothetical protein L249_6386 [Ophiocordyceps polyrhachis-furcata BCC 54312]|uniref:Methyltransferase small domain-containing protein n=1 Tax=Ophiocordyceps polyrhachis-furcata BCC 54312 TaxID=1330021 RepID=A0A367LLP6_9HYPO|nr:hypothetical protein L249_6386 [Ophiocordyceps polyrhachis-furcata BCC 54312]
MCTVTFFRHRDCKHMWATVTEPCGPGMGFYTCRSFEDTGVTKARPPVYRTRGRSCPRCGTGEAVDGNVVRLVERMGWGVKIGVGPDGDDWGVDLRCVMIGRKQGMLPTPDTSHVPYERVYEPSEDSFLLLDTLSSEAQRLFLRNQLSSSSHHPRLVVEVGTGSGVVLAFVHAHAEAILGSRHVFTSGVDVSAVACRATVATVNKAHDDDDVGDDDGNGRGCYLGACVADLVSPWRNGSVDLLIFNPPYVPTPSLPAPPNGGAQETQKPSFENDSHLLELAYAGGRDGMQTTDRLIDDLPRVLSPAGCAYIILCAQNKPPLVMERIRAFGSTWRAEAVASSGKTAGWEKLQVVRVWREPLP